MHILTHKKGRDDPLPASVDFEILSLKLEKTTAIRRTYHIYESKDLNFNFVTYMYIIRKQLNVKFISKALLVLRSLKVVYGRFFFK